MSEVRELSKIARCDPCYISHDNNNVDNDDNNNHDNNNKPFNGTLYPQLQWAGIPRENMHFLLRASMDIIQYPPFYVW